MVETQRPSDVAVYNERSLKALDRAIAFSQGEFSLVLVRCNYKRLRDRILHQLRELGESRYEIRELNLPSSVTTLYTTIQAHGFGEVGERESGRKEEFIHSNPGLSTNPHPLIPSSPPALFILGLESVESLEDLLTSTNQVRDEFRKCLRLNLKSRQVS